MRLKAHPGYAIYKDWFRREALRASELEAELYRVAGPRHTTASEILAGVGAFKRGGRWNPPGMHVVYLSRAPETAMHEANEHRRYHRIPLSKGMPKLIVAVRVAVEKVLDLTKASTLPESMGILMAEDWREIMARRDESTTQAMGRAAFGRGAGTDSPFQARPGRNKHCDFSEEPLKGQRHGPAEPGSAESAGKALLSRLFACNIACTGIDPTGIVADNLGLEVVMARRLMKRPLTGNGMKVLKSTDAATKAAVYGGSLRGKINVRHIRQKFGVSQEELGRVTGYSTRSVAGWESGQAVSESARQKLVEAERLRAALAQIIPEDQLGTWLREPNPAFEGQAPIQIIERGESDRLWRMVFQIDGNVAN